MPALSAMKKEELIEAIRALGEEPPLTWKVLDLKCRLQELEEEQGISRKSGVMRTDLESWVIRLKHASKKKTCLQTFVTEDLGGSLTGNETMEKLTRLAMDRIYQISKPTGQDPVGMGKHAAATYAEVFQEYPEYCQWVIKTAEEGEAHPRLTRLSRPKRDHQGVPSVRFPVECPWCHAPSRRQREWEPIGKSASHGTPETDAGDDARHGREGGFLAGRHGLPARGAAPKEGDRVPEQCISGERGEDREVDPPEQQREETTSAVRELSSRLERFLEKEAERTVAGSFQSLVQDQRTILVEVARCPESLLTSHMQKTMGYPDAALRCAHWNGFDLETKHGVEAVVNLIRRARPLHVWMSPECGPYSPMQSINQRTEQQKRDLEEKRRRALKQYMGCSAIWQFCVQEGIHVSWEWAERCQGWRLPFMQKLSKKYNPFYSTTHGCQVNLRDPGSQRLVHKGWRVMSTHARLSDLLGLPCRCGPGYHHAKCEGHVASRGAFYTPEFVKRVCLGITQELTPHMLTRELEGQTCLLAHFGKGATCVCVC